MNTEIMWNIFLDVMRKKISPLSYNTWFKDTRLYKIDNGVAVIVVPMSLHKKHLEETYLDDIKEIFNSLTGTNFDFKFVLENEIEDIKKVINIDEIKQEITKHSIRYANLNSKFTFDNFIVGNSNRFAFTAAKAVAEKPGKAYNPLFLYGKNGLGKTHLVHAIGNYIIENSNKKVLYISSRNFVNDCYSFFKNNNDNENNFESICSFKNFKRKYNDIDVLIIDDIQFLGDYDIKVQEYFFNIFNELHDSNKQIIITSDRSVEDLKMLENRLITRFNWGLTAYITLPEFDLKSENEENAQQKRAEDISMEAIEYIIDITDSYAKQLACVVETLNDMKNGNMNKNSKTESKKNRNGNMNKNYETGVPKNKVSNMSSYVVEYLNENEFKKKERNLKKYNMLAYKKLIFECVPALRKGNFQGCEVSKDCKCGIVKYQYKLPTDKIFSQVYGEIKLHYTVNDKQKIIMLDTITPEEILSDGCQKELATYKGVMLSKKDAERDMFKINLLNNLNKNG